LPLPSHCAFPYNCLPMENRLHLYYGYGKGKTTAAVGLAIRALGAGKKVAIVQFDKGYDGQNEHYSERKVLRTFPGLHLFPFGKERVLGPTAFRFKNEPGDLEEAQKALAKAAELLASGGVDLLILDEILAAVMTKLLTREDVMGLVDLYNQNRRFELVMTGHQAWPELVEKADLATEMRKEKHYFDRKAPSKEGIEF
jgi:cob(I)alamin adenosyltransferase